MIKRLVRMQFRLEEVQHFIALFDETAEQIRGFEGCLHLELWQDAGCQNILSTFSIWDSPDHLERYRQSTLFKNTWKKTKSMFEEKAVASSFVPLRNIHPDCEITI